MEAIEINKGEGVRAEFTWKDEGGPINFTGRQLTIVEAYPAALTAGTVTVLDAEAGRAEIVIPAALAASMGMGRTSWIRIGMSLPGGEPDTTPKIAISVE